MSTFKKFIQEKMIQFQNELNPDFWKDNKLDPEVRDGLLKVAGKFEEFLKLKVKPVDIIFTGSMANYNWTSKSDVDLHVVFDYSKIDSDIDIVKELASAKKALWNDTYTITAKTYPVELYAQDSNEPHYSHGIYSVMNDKWNVEPSKEKNLEIDDKAIDVKADPFRKMVDDAIKKEDLDKLSEITKKLKTYRTAGLEQGGEYSLENLVFKELRNDGTLEKLSNAKVKLTDKELTVKES